MWLAVKALLIKWALGRSFGGLVSLLLMLAFPLAGVLKVIGLPLLIVLGVVGLPMLLLLAAIGLPILLVVGTVSVMMALVGGVLAFAFAALKWVLPIVLLFFAIRWVVRKMRGRGDTGTTTSAPIDPLDVPPGSEPSI